MIEVKNLSFTYNGKDFALSDINLTIHDGETVAVIGRIGSGKSTLIEHFNGLLKPTKGQVFLDGEDIQNLDRKEICKRVGLVFQYLENQLFEETVYRDIAFGPKNLGLSETEISERVNAAAELVGLDRESLLKSPFELSGGEMRRAAIAGVLAMNPKTLILDEPMAGLDPRGRSDMLKIIKNVRGHITVIFVTHSMEDAAAAERVIVMKNGKIDTDAGTDEVFSNTGRLEAAGLDVPRITKVMNKLRERGYDFPNGIYTAAKAADAIKNFLKGEGDV